MVRTRESDNQPEYEDRQVEGPVQEQPQVRVTEVEVNLSLLNQKLNYLISLVERL